MFRTSVQIFTKKIGSLDYKLLELPTKMLYEHLKDDFFFFMSFYKTFLTNQNIMQKERKVTRKGGHLITKTTHKLVCIFCNYLWFYIFVAKII